MASEPGFSLERPPLIELVVGVQFDRLPVLTAAHLGVFWRELGADWPDVNEAPVIEPQFERFAEESALPFFPGLRLKLSSQPEVRLQIRNSTQVRMVQVQNGRLHYNWLRREGENYPSYPQVKQEFDKVLGRFREFVVREVGGEFQPNQWELTYVDHIPKGTIWTSPEQWPRIFRNWCVVPFEHADMQMEALEAEWHYEIKPSAGRLHLKLSTGRTAKPVEEDVLIVNTTARGPVKPGDEDYTLDKGLDRGHKAVVAAFERLTSDTAQDYWDTPED
jgi:uncharacterized protein (TIGR04255 family)